MSGAVTHFPAPTQFNYPWAIALGPDGNMWFTEGNNDKLGRITPTGTVTEYVLPKGSVPTGVVAGPDGNLWITEAGSNVIARVAIGGLRPGSRVRATQFPVPSPHSMLNLIAAGPDGNPLVHRAVRQ